MTAGTSSSAIDIRFGNGSDRKNYDYLSFYGEGSQNEETPIK